jgi:hypothetical protein
MEAAKIVLLSLAIFCGYGALFGEVCAWISPEAYTIARKAAFGNLPVALSGPLWGIFDFMPFAAGIGIGTALAAHVGNRPTVKAFFFRRPMLILVPVVAVIGTITGFLCHSAVLDRSIPIPKNSAWLPNEKIPPYAATWWAMIASQATMILGGITLAVWTWRKRAVFEKMVRERGY